MQFCNTSLRQREQRSVALNHYVVAWRTSTNYVTQQPSLTQKVWYYSLVEWIIGCTRSWQFLLNGSIFAVQNLRGGTAPFVPLVMRLVTVTDGCVVLSWSFVGTCKPVDSSRRPRKDKFDVVREICNRQQNACSLLTRSALSNPNGLLGQKLCHYLNRGRIMSDTLVRAAHWIACFDLSKLNLA